MTVAIDFFYDLSSPWTRLAFHNLGPALDGLPATVTLRPMLVGGVFNAVNPTVYQARAEGSARLAQSFVWLHEWARLAGVAASGGRVAGVRLKRGAGAGCTMPSAAT